MFGKGGWLWYNHENPFLPGISNRLILLFFSEERICRFSDSFCFMFLLFEDFKTAMYGSTQLRSTFVLVLAVRR